MPSKSERRAARKQKQVPSEEQPTSTPEYQDLAPIHIFRPGMTVVLHALLNRPELNGRKGKITRGNPKPGRVAVLMELPPYGPYSVSLTSVLKLADASTAARGMISTEDMFESDWTEICAAKEGRQKELKTSTSRASRDPCYEEERFLERVLLSWRCLRLSKNGKKVFLRKRATDLVKDQLQYRDSQVEAPCFGADYFWAELRRVRTQNLSAEEAAAWDWSESDDLEGSEAEDFSALA